jgi:hypothetical protein
VGGTLGLLVCVLIAIAAWLAYSPARVEAVETLTRQNAAPREAGGFVRTI